MATALPPAFGDTVAPAGTLAAVELSSAVQALARLGADTDAILARAGIPRALLDDPHARVPATLEHALWTAIEALTGDRAIGLRIGVEHARHGTYSLLEYIAVHSPTLRQALAGVQKITPLVDDLGHVDVIEHGELATVGIRRDGIDRARGYVDALGALVFSFYSKYVPDFRITGVAYTQQRPAAVKPYLALFGLMPAFGAPQNTLTFPRHLLDASFQGSDPAVGFLLRQHADSLLQALPKGDPFVTAVRRALAVALAAGNATPRAVARMLAMSERTLRRRLALAGVSYQTLLDELRHAIACQRLEHTDESVEAIGQSLGFASRSAFQRAFRRFAGPSPSEYRAARRG